MQQKPNFIVIHTDQQRYDCVGLAGRRTGIYTPYIDSIGYQGANFTSCYSTCPVCIPQRMTLLTGQLPEHHGLYTNVGVPYFPLETTLPREMRKGGYQTALVGRNLHTYPSNESYGFEYYLPGDPSSENKETTDPFFKYVRSYNNSETGGYYGNGMINNSRAAAPFHLADEFHHTKWVTNRALDFLENRDPSRPFMLFVGYYAPHSPHNPPAEYFNRYYWRDDLDSPYIGSWETPPDHSGSPVSPYVDLKGEELRVLRAGYYGNIAFADAQIGRILMHPEIRTSKNTYIIFTSDHGDLLGDHYMYQKSRPYEGAIHLPLCIKGPGLSDGQTIENPVGWHDLMPTILDLAGLHVPESVDGKSLAPLLRGKEPKQDWRTYIHGECVHHIVQKNKADLTEPCLNYYCEAGSHYLTDGKVKYIWYVTTGREQLFDLQNDWKEQTDLSNDPQWQPVLEHWRQLMVTELKNREEHFSDGEKLIPGKTPLKFTAKVGEVIQQRLDAGLKMAYYKPPKQPERSVPEVILENHLMD